jgi:hypothetical protein
MLALGSKQLGSGAAKRTLNASSTSPRDRLDCIFVLVKFRSKWVSKIPWFVANGQDRTPPSKNISFFEVSDRRKILPRGRYFRRGCPRKFLKHSVTFFSKSGVPDLPKNVGLRKRTIGVRGRETNTEWRVQWVHVIARLYLHARKFSFHTGEWNTRICCKRSRSDPTF